MSFDEVAIESVGLDFLVSEFGPVLGRRNRTDKIDPVKNCDNYLHEAVLANNPPSGTLYKPDGVNLTSLGVHEHWNNIKEKNITETLGPAIELNYIKFNLLQKEKTELYENKKDIITLSSQYLNHCQIICGKFVKLFFIYTV